MSIESNVASRRAAEEWLECADDLGDTHYWSVIRDYALSRVPLPRCVTPPELVAEMTDDEAARFEEHMLGGPYSRLTVREIASVRRWYLEELARDLERYLRRG